MVMTDKNGGCIQMNVGKKLANTVFYDCTGNLDETVYDHIERFAPSSENNVKAYRRILKQFNVPLEKRVKDLTRKELENLYQAIKRQEAFNKTGKTYRNGNQI